MHAPAGRIAAVLTLLVALASFAFADPGRNNKYLRRTRPAKVIDSVKHRQYKAPKAGTRLPGPRPRAPAAFGAPAVHGGPSAMPHIPSSPTTTATTTTPTNGPSPPADTTTSPTTTTTETTPTPTPTPQPPTCPSTATVDPATNTCVCRNLLPFDAATGSCPSCSSRGLSYGPQGVNGPCGVPCPGGYQFGNYYDREQTGCECPAGREYLDLDAAAPKIYPPGAGYCAACAELGRQTTPSLPAGTCGACNAGLVDFRTLGEVRCLACADLSRNDLSSSSCGTCLLPNAGTIPWYDSAGGFKTQCYVCTDRGYEAPVNGACTTCQAGRGKLVDDTSINSYPCDDCVAYGRNPPVNGVCGTCINGATPSRSGGCS